MHHISSSQLHLIKVLSADAPAVEQEEAALPHRLIRGDAVFSELLLVLLAKPSLDLVDNLFDVVGDEIDALGLQKDLPDGVEPDGNLSHLHTVITLVAPLAKRSVEIATNHMPAARWLLT